MQKTKTQHCPHHNKWCHPFNILGNFRHTSETEVTFSTPTTRSDNGKAALAVRNLCDHLLELKMDTLDNRNITSKHSGCKGLYLNKAGSTSLAKNIFFSLTD